MTRTQLPLAVTMGDPAGIGLDITLQTLAMAEQRALPPLFLIASADAIAERARLLGLTVPIKILSLRDEFTSSGGDQLAVLDLGPIGPVHPGKTDTAHAPAIINAIERAVALVGSGYASGIVTNPIAKATLTAAGFKHPGHTEFLGELAGRLHPGKDFSPVMMLASDELKVVPLTVHVPLVDVPRLITAELVMSTIRITIADLTRYFGLQKPRIAVAGLNPHAGESGTLGREEIDSIAPAIQQLRAEGHEVFGPLSGDTLFHAGARERYDAAICMYHDQALIPLKTLAFDSGVNVTLGLPFVRTSPDHGTAFDIAGTGRANPASFVAALHLASRMAANAKAGQ